jgi:hypothetical protein
MTLKPKHNNHESLKDSLKFDESDIYPSNIAESMLDISTLPKHFLRRFTQEEMYSMMEKIGLIKHLKNMGFKSLITEIDVDDAGINYMKLFWEEKTHAKQLLDIRLSESMFLPESKYFPQDADILPYNMINIEWLSAKNPLREFNGHKPQLPGQANPGLGVLKFCFKVLYIMAKEVFKDGFIDIPNHMHGAIMYSKQFKFFDPVHEGIIRAVIRDLNGYALNDISWGIITETIIDLEKDKPIVYDPGVQIHYVSRRMKRYFNSKQYKETYNFYYKKKRYKLDYEEMIKRKEGILLLKKIEDL